MGSWQVGTQLPLSGETIRPIACGPGSLHRALALNCFAPINDRKGAEAKDWRSGKPVRVVRNVKGRKHSKYAPVEGNRYDGIYKVTGDLPPPPVSPTPCTCPSARSLTTMLPLAGGEVLAREGQVWLPGVALPPA